MNLSNNNRLQAPNTEEYKACDTATTAATSSESTAATSKGSLNGASVAIVEHPHYSTIRLVERTLNPYPTPQEKISPFIQVLGNPLKAMSTWSESDKTAPAVLAAPVTPVGFDEKIDSLLVQQPLHGLVMSTTEVCARKAMRVVEENAPPSLTGAARKEQLQEVHERIFGLAVRSDENKATAAYINAHPRVGEPPVTCEPFKGTAEIACTGVARSAIKNTLAFAQKIKTHHPDHEALPFFNEERVATAAALASLEAYSSTYRTLLPSYYAHHPELDLQPVSGVAFASPTLVTKVIFAEGDISSEATKAASDAATKIIAGAWEAALVRAQKS